MNIALIGHGSMGRIIESLAVGKGHETVVIINESHAALSSAQLAETLRTADVAIDFSTAEAVPRNVEACMLAGLPLVEGTTGWNDLRPEIEAMVHEANGAMVFGSNFSVGVNLLYRIVDSASSLLAKFPEYEVFIEERHHSRKKDAPSGTALKLKDIVRRHYQNDFTISATRAGNIPGTHRVGFDGCADQILLEHSARSREGFALGANLAAEWIIGKKGFYEFADILDDICKERLP